MSQLALKLEAPSPRVDREDPPASVANHPVAPESCRPVPAIDLDDPAAMSPSDPLLAALGPGTERIVGVFRLMGIAEEVLADLQPPAWTFGALCPSPVLRDHGGEVLYRSHARELATRALTGKDLAPGTDAECLAVVVAVALKAPLRSEAMALAEHLFAAVMPEKAPDVFPVRTPERWAGQVAEDLARLRKQLEQRDRRLAHGTEGEGV